MPLKPQLSNVIINYSRNFDLSDQWSIDECESKETAIVTQYLNATDWV